jgi:hypothetical protein
MSCPRSVVCLAPLPSSPTVRNPRILLAGTHQPALLRCLDGWPRRHGKAVSFVAQFIEQMPRLAEFADNRFDLAVIQSPGVGEVDLVIHHLTRIARQGLIRLG